MQQKEIKDLLKSREIKVTNNRLLLLEVLANENKAVGRSKLQKLINCDRVTLYRTINTLIDAGIIHKAHTGSDDVYYAMCKHTNCSHLAHQHKHIHFKCKECMDIKCVETSKELVVQLPNFTIDEVNIEVTGICNQCQQN